MKIPSEILTQHIAVLGKTGSGKTSTAKLAIEQVVAAGVRVCVLDPIKSDWWGLTSSADGRKAGLPFHILGGPHGHVPLHATAGKVVAEIVANGALPLSIIDMADFEPGGQAKFFVDFVPVLLRKMRGVVYLVIEEAHLFAPKERSGIGAENLSIHWAKTMATAGRSKGIRLVLVTQRTQALHNALLGSCDTLIAHRLTAPADQEPVVKWLKANTSKEVLEQVSSSLASVKTGEGWICSGEAKLFERVTFPRIKTYDNTATPTGDGETREIKTAPVDQEKLRTIIGDAVEKAKADDPRELRKQIAELRQQVAKAGHKITALDTPAKEKPVLTDADRALLEKVGGQFAEAARLLSLNIPFDLDDFHKLVVGELTRLKADLTTELADRRAEFLAVLERKSVQKILGKLATVESGRNYSESITTRKTMTPHEFGRTFEAAGRTEPPRQRAGGTTIPSNGHRAGAEQRILNALAELEQLGARQPARELVAFLANYTHLQSKGFVNAMSALRSGGLVDYPNSGTVMLTDAGREEAQPPAAPRTAAEVQQRIIGLLGGASGRILQPLINAYPQALARADVAAAAGYGHLQSKGFVNAMSRLRSLGFIDYPDTGTAIAKPVLFLEDR